MCNHEPSPYSRRRFIQQGVVLASMASTAPIFIERSAQGMMRPDGSLVTSQAGVPEDHVLVIIQLAGGNDGLNTVVPYGDRTYYTRRPGIAIPEPGSTTSGFKAIQLDQSRGLGIHERFSDFKALIDDGSACIVQGVGYPNPNRSHFTSTDIWHTGNTGGNGDGWVGRYFDNQCNGSPIPESSISIGREAPLALQGRINKPISFESAELFRWMGGDLHPDLDTPYQSISRAGSTEGEDDQHAFLMRTALDAQVSSDRIRKAMAKQTLVQYPNGNLANQLRAIGAMIRDGLSTRVYYASLGGFDTHAGQNNPHANLLSQVGGSLRAFHSDLKAQGNSGRVLTMVFSEFGRRVGENGSGGTDHGTAAPMFFVGDMIQPGVHGDLPSLSNLDDGDLKYAVDFRTVYGDILENWMGASSASVLGKDFASRNSMSLFKGV
jgi:uncharacterized protein (DUF1501 family)